MEQVSQDAFEKAEPTVQIQPLDQQQRAKKYYRPAIHRTISISFLITIALVLIALIEYAVRTLPHHSSTRRHDSPNTIHKRQDHDATMALINSIGNDDSTSNFENSTEPEDSQSTGAPPPASFLSDDVNAFALPSPTATPLTVGAPPPGAFLKDDTNTFGIKSKPVETMRSYPYRPIESFLKDEISTFAVDTTPTGPFITTSGAFLKDETSTFALNAQATAPTTTPKSGAPPAGSFLKGTTGTFAAQRTSATVTAYSPAPESFLTEETSTFKIAATSSHITSNAEATNSVSPLESNKPPAFVKQRQNYFYGVYLPVMLAVMFRMLIGYFYTTTKMMEPFSILSKAGGAKAKDFMFINYLSASDTWAPIFALFSGHWLMLWTAVLYLMVQLLTTLSSEMFGIYPSFYKLNSDTAIGGAALWVHPRIARLLQGILAFVCVMLIGVRFLLSSYRSHIYSDPTTLVGLASLVHHPSTIQDIDRLNQYGSKRRNLKMFKGKSYHLGYYQAFDGTERYGIVSDSPALTQCNVPDPNFSSPPDLTDQKKRFSLEPIHNIMILLVTGGLLGLIAAYHVNTADNGFERFMDAQNFGPRFLLTIVGIIIKSQWSRLERRSVVFAPFDTAISSTAAAEKTLLRSRTLVPMSTFFVSVARGSFGPALMAFTALLAEALIIILPGIPFAASQVYIASLSSRYICFGILSFMIVVLVIHIITSLLGIGKNDALPQDPNTLGAMMMYLAGTRVAEEVGDLGDADGKEVKTSVRAWGKGRTVYMAKVNGVGGERWKLDFDDGMGHA